MVCVHVWKNLRSSQKILSSLIVTFAGVLASWKLSFLDICSFPVCVDSVARLVHFFADSHTCQSLAELPSPINVYLSLCVSFLYSS